MSHRDSEEEKLVEEMPRNLMADLYNLWEPIVASEYEWEPIERRVIESVERIGKAYADGELELPGEVGRIPLRKLLKSPYDPDKVVWQWMSELALAIDSDTIIALRKEEEK